MQARFNDIRISRNRDFRGPNSLRENTLRDNVSRKHWVAVTKLVAGGGSSVAGTKVVFNERQALNRRRERNGDCCDNTPLAPAATIQVAGVK